MDVDSYSKTICGVDEAGRGPIIGPLVVAGVKVINDAKLKALGVRDSKRHTPERRAKLAVAIKNIAEYHIEMLTADEIDRVRCTKTLNLIEAELFAKTINLLDPTVAYVDAVDPNELKFKLEIQKRLKGRVRLISKHGADNIYPVVSAASILAKTVRDNAVKKIASELGVDTVGSGYTSDPITMQFLKNWVETHGTLPPHTRKTWKTVKLRLALPRMTKKLDEY
jgi:ribonuclease HII